MKAVNLTKGHERFIFRYEVGSEAMALDAMIAMVKRPDLAFDYFDAAVLSHQVGKHLAQELKPYLPKEVSN